MREQVVIGPDEVTLPTMGSRRLRLTAAVVLLLGGAAQVGVGALTGELAFVLAGVVAAAFGISVGRGSARTTRVDADGWTDPTRVRNQHLRWDELRSVRLRPQGTDRVVLVEPRDEARGPALRVGRCPEAQVDTLAAALSLWAEPAGVVVVVVPR